MNLYPNTHRWRLLHKKELARRGERKYFTRYTIIETPWFALLLHRMHNPDPNVYLHDHPFNFWTFVLWGGYTELNKKGYEKVGWLNLKKHFAKHFHSIVKVDRGTTTLVFRGRRYRRWGFDIDGKWTDAKKYLQGESDE